MNPQSAVNRNQDLILCRRAIVRPSGSKDGAAVPVEGQATATSLAHFQDEGAGLQL
jgi:hypothetical protein